MAREPTVSKLAPEALLVWDEYSVDDNPGGFEEAVKHEISKYADSAVELKFRVIKVEVSEDRVRDLLVEDPTIKGLVE
jgi:hypothetical protein